MLRPLPAKLTQRHIGRQVRIKEENRGAVIRRCWNRDHSVYTGAGGAVLDRPDEVFYKSGVIDSLGDSGRRCLVNSPAVDRSLWLDVECLENAP